MHRQQLELTDELLLQGHWGKEDAAVNMVLNVHRSPLSGRNVLHLNWQTRQISVTTRPGEALAV